jgi:hypothetical protein
MLKENKSYEERNDDLTYRKLKRMELKANRKQSARLEALKRKGEEIFIKKMMNTFIGD